MFYILEKHDSFVRFYSMQSIILGGAWLLFSIAASIVGLIFRSIPVIAGILDFFGESSSRSLISPSWFSGSLPPSKRSLVRAGKSRTSVRWRGSKSAKVNR